MSTTDDVIWTLQFRTLKTTAEIHSEVVNLQVAAFMRLSDPRQKFNRPSLATVSGILSRLVRRGVASRCPNVGRRGGYGYVRARMR